MERPGDERPNTENHVTYARPLGEECVSCRFPAPCHLFIATYSWHHQGLVPVPNTVVPVPVLFFNLIRPCLPDSSGYSTDIVTGTSRAPLYTPSFLNPASFTAFP
jgi:hypothetical protein